MLLIYQILRSEQERLLLLRKRTLLDFRHVSTEDLEREVQSLLTELIHIARSYSLWGTSLAHPISLYSPRYTCLIPRSSLARESRYDHLYCLLSVVLVHKLSLSFSFHY